MPTVVPITRVSPNNRDNRTTFVNKMMSVLQRHGQIEPLQVKETADGRYVTFEQDVYGADILIAARILKWNTILIVVMKRFEY